MRALLVDANGRALGDLAVPEWRPEIRVPLTSLFREKSPHALIVVRRRNYDYDAPYVVAVFQADGPPSHSTRYFVYVLDRWEFLPR